MSNDNADTAGEARKGLIDNVAGKAKEIAGAVTGNDALTEEGQLQQSEAQARRAAVADDAIADARRQEAATELSETNHEAAAEKQAADDSADAVRRAVDSEQTQEHAEAEERASQQETADRRLAEQRADDVAVSGLDDAQSLAVEAAATEQQATEDQARLEREAAAAEQQAASLRDQTRSNG